MSSTGGVPLTGQSLSSSLRSSDALLGKDFRELVETPQVYAVGDGGQLQSWNVEFREFLGALCACADSAGMFDRLGQQAREIGVGQADAHPRQGGPHRGRIDLTLGGLR